MAILLMAWGISRDRRRCLCRLATARPVQLFRFGTIEELKRTGARNVLYEPRPGGSR
jgi:hypothetical protein